MKRNFYCIMVVPKIVENSDEYKAIKFVASATTVSEFRHEKMHSHDAFIIRSPEFLEAVLKHGPTIKMIHNHGTSNIGSVICYLNHVNNIAAFRPMEMAPAIYQGKGILTHVLSGMVKYVKNAEGGKYANYRPVEMGRRVLRTVNANTVHEHFQILRDEMREARKANPPKPRFARHDIRERHIPKRHKK